MKNQPHGQYIFKNVGIISLLMYVQTNYTEDKKLTYSTVLGFKALQLPKQTKKKSIE